MVRDGAPRGDEFIANARGKGEIGQPVAVKMADLAMAQAEFHATETVRVDRHAGPAQHFPA